MIRKFFALLGEACNDQADLRSIREARKPAELRRCQRLHAAGPLLAVRHQKVEGQCKQKQSNLK